jgi:hypothetical protein
MASDLVKCCSTVESFSGSANAELEPPCASNAAGITRSIRLPWQVCSQRSAVSTLLRCRRLRRYRANFRRTSCTTSVFPERARLNFVLRRCQQLCGPRTACWGRPDVADPPGAGVLVLVDVGPRQSDSDGSTATLKRSGERADPGNGRKWGRMVDDGEIWGKNGARWGDLPRFPA